MGTLGCSSLQAAREGLIDAPASEGRWHRAALRLASCEERRNVYAEQSG